MTYESPFRLPDFQFIDLSYGGRTLQMRPSQLTTVNIARAFRLIADTIILVSERDTVALPQDGVFHDVDDCYAWTVEGEKATTNIPSGAAASQRGKFPSTESRWKPQAFPPTLPSARAGTASSKHVSRYYSEYSVLCHGKNGPPKIGSPKIGSPPELIC